MASAINKVQTCINKLSIKRDNVFSKMMLRQKIQRKKSSSESSNSSKSRKALKVEKANDSSESGKSNDSSK